MRESDGFRLELEQIHIRFQGKNILSVTDVAAYCGKSREWVRQHLGINGDGCTAVRLANILAKM